MSATTLDGPLRAAPTKVPGPTLGRLVAVELRKMTDTRAGFWLLVSNALIAAATVVITLIWARADQQTLAHFFTATIESTSVLLPVLGILAVTSEWSQRTALATFTLVARRERVIVAKLLAGVGLALIAVLVCLLAAVVANALAPALGDADGSWSLTLSDLGRATLYQAIGLLGGLAFGLALMSSAPAIVLYFILPILFSGLGNVIPGFLETARWLDLRAAMTLLTDLDAPMWGEAWAQLATGAGLWLVLPLAIGFVRLRRREVAFS